jgi:hypothetical protein
MTGLALRRVAPLRPLPGRRIAAAVLVLGAAFAAAAVLYSHRDHHLAGSATSACGANPLVPHSVAERCARRLETRGWAEPTALAIVFLGLAGSATVLVTTRRPRT